MKENTKIHEFHGCCGIHKKAEREKEEMCERIRTSFTRRESYTKMMEDWAKTWTETNLQEWERTDKVDMGEPEECTPREWNARVEFFRLARMKRSCESKDQQDDELYADLKKKHTSEEIRKITARAESKDWSATIHEKKKNGSQKQKNGKLRIRNGEMAR